MEPPHPADAPPPLPRLAAWLRQPGNLLFALLLAVQPLPIWAFRYFPSQDGPAHIENAVILREYHRPDREAFRTFYVLNTRPEPNWFGHLALAGLMFFVPPLIAEKLLLTGYALLLPLAARYAVRAVQPSAGFLAVLAFPFVWNSLLHRGFYNFCWSLPLFLFVVGWAAKNRAGFGPRQALVLALLALLTYFCHLVSVVMAGVALAVMGLWRVALEARRLRKQGGATWKALWPALRAHALWPGLAFLPPALLTLLFLGRQGAAPLPRHSVADLATGLGTLIVLPSFRPAEALAAVALFWLFVGLAGALLTVKLARQRLDAGDGWLLAAVAFIGLYFAAPEGASGGTFLNYRIMFYPFFTLLLWFAGQPFPAWLRWAVPAAGAALTGLMLWSCASAYASFQAEMEEFLSGEEWIAENSTLLPLCFQKRLTAGDGRELAAGPAPFLHPAGHIAARRGVVELDNYEAGTDYFPTKFRPELDPFRHLSRDGDLFHTGLERVPPRVDFLAYGQRTGKPVDYVLIWGARPEHWHEPDGQDVLRQLREGYERIFTSPGGRMELYRRKGFGDAPEDRRQDRAGRTAGVKPAARTGLGGRRG